MMKISIRILFTISILYFTNFLQAAINAAPTKAIKNTITRIEPSSWWIGMKNPQVEIIVFHPQISSFTPEINWEGISIISTEKAENPDFVYLTLQISATAAAGDVPIYFVNGKKKLVHSFNLQARSNSSGKVLGVNASDFIYLAMPDRFCNADPSNDIVAGLEQTNIRRDSLFVRHGGDLAGVESKLNYLSELGVTALWLNPVHENNQPISSYHGYAITDHYKIDPRFGTNEQYRLLVEKARALKIKTVMDIVPNHVGDRHWLYKNQPSKSWFNQWDKFTKTTYRAPTLIDPYATETDRKQFTNGWFDRHMPDLNQRDAHVAKFLTQSYIWWVEYTGLDAYRIDTYAYPDQNYLSQMAQDLLAEYPNLGMFAEIWDHGVAIQSFFTEEFKARGRFDSHLPSAIDFQLHYAINDALTKPFGWTDGAARIYYTLAQDILYKKAANNVTFLDNHDLSRFFSVVGENVDKYKSGIAMLLTMRGIPSMYYGTEILMKNYADPDGKVRADFPGGWAADSSNKFLRVGRNPAEEDAFRYVQKLAIWHKQSPAIAKGDFHQFVPEKGIYVYFRISDTEKIMVIVNTNATETAISVERYDEFLKSKRTGKSIISNGAIDLNELKLKGFSTEILSF